MSQTKKVALLAGAALSLGLALPALAQNDRAYATEIAADSLSRSSGQGGSGAFKLADGDRSLTVGGAFQFRYTMNFRSDGTSASPAGTISADDDFTTGFTNSKTKLWFMGNINKDISFKIQGNFNGTDSSASGNFRLDDAYADWKVADGVSVRTGQFKLPVLREESISDFYQLSAQRSLLNSIFNQGRSQGIQIGWKGDSFRASAAFSDGWRSRNTDFNAGTGSPGEADYALNARVDWKWAGDWNRFDDFTSWQGEGYAGMLGGAVLWQSAGETGDGVDATVNAAGSDFLLYTVDVHGEGDGWNIYAAFIGSNTSPDPVGEGSTSAFGVQVQGGFFVDAQWELFGRWEWLTVDDDVDNAVAQLSNDDFHFLTFGANYYVIPKSHAAKITADVIIALNETYDLVSTDVLAGNGGTRVPNGGNALGYTGGGILGDIDSGEFAFQLQFQILF